MTGWAGLSQDHVDALAALAPSVADRADTVVPASPKWTVTDVYRHLAGVASDNIRDRMEGAPRPEWTARQVAERADADLATLVAELAGNTGGLAAKIEGNPAPAVVWDTVVHHTDLHEALGLPRIAERLWQPVLEAAAPRLLASQQVSLHSGDATYGAGGAELEVPPYELFRTLFSRRSRSQIAAWAGDALDPESVGVFGARDDDQPLG